MAAPDFIRTDLPDLYGSACLPVLEEIFAHEVEQAQLVRDQIFKVVKTDREIYQTTEIGDMALFSAVSEGADYTMNSPVQGADKTFTITKHGLGFSISEEMIEDGRFDLVGQMVRKLAQSGRETQEVSAMNVFNNGFSSETAQDGLSVFNTAHTLPGGATFRNRGSAHTDLSAASLEAALVDFEQVFVGDTGIVKRIKPKYLVVPPALKRYAMELIGSDLKADTGNNNMNSLKSDGLTVVCSARLTDSDAWFLTADASETGLRIIERKPLETKAAGPDVGWINDSVLYKARYREARGVTHAMGIWGSAGI
jgi:hypothetical protein